jgi:hypothetical protein
MHVRQLAPALVLTLAALALGAATPTGAVEQTTGPLYVIVPFGDPENTDPVLKNATRQFTVDLADRQIRSAVSTPIDAIEAVGTARQMCGAYNADGF